MSRPTHLQAKQIERAQRHLDLIRQLPNRLTDTVIADLIRRASELPGGDGYPPGHRGDPVTGGTAGNPTMTTALNDRPAYDPVADDIATILGCLAEAAGHAAQIQRRLTNLNRGVGADPGHFEPECHNQKCRDKASNHPDKPSWRLTLGRCPACYKYWQRNGEERPMGHRTKAAS